MAPLLYEQSQQAQFLKPTVITLVYGLGFGMVLVLLVVPALVAVQHDMARQVAAMRRGLRAPVGRLRFGLYALWSTVLGWGGLTLGWTLWHGALHPGISGLFSISGDNATQLALLLFIAGAGAIAVLGYVLGGLSFALRRRAS